MTGSIDFLPLPGHHGRMSLTKVAVVVQDGVEPFGLGVACEVFAEPYHPEDGNPVHDFVVCTPRPGRVLGSSGFDLEVESDLGAAEDADLVVVTPRRDHREEDPEVSVLLRAAHARGAWVFAHCTAVFDLGHAGLLEGRRVTTHWRHSDELAARWPAAVVDPDVLYVRDGTIITGAGAAAGLDAALHLLREEYGSQVAATAARRMVVPPHRDGGQAQYVDRSLPPCDSDTLAPLLAWIADHVDEDLSVDTLAARVHMSPRTFARRFKAETGTTPWGWVVGQRVRAAEQLLERTSRPVEQVASEVGFANAAALRHHFTRVRGVTPQHYRRTFACADD